jgi:hypothetical protein
MGGRPTKLVRVIVLQSEKRHGSGSREASRRAPDVVEVGAVLESAARVKLESNIRSASAAELLRINPLRFAADKCLAAAETIDLFPHAAALGLFEMNWVILCPLCSCVIDSFRALRNLDKHCRCVICQSVLSPRSMI